MKKIILGLMAVFMLVGTSAQAAEQLKYRLLLQVSEDSVDHLVQALNNARSAQKEFGAGNIEVEIVVFGGGVNTLKFYAPIPVKDRVREVVTEGVRIVVSSKSMRAYHLRPSDMLEEVRYVESAVVELVEKQTLGWSYIRP